MLRTLPLFLILVSFSGFSQFSGYNSITNWSEFTNDFDYGDIDNDSLGDIVIANNSTITYQKNLGNGNFSGIKTIEVNRIFDQIELVDVNRDGKLDIVSSNNTGIGYYLNNGNAEFDNFQEITTDNTSILRSYDINGDGFKEVVYYSSSLNDLKSIDFGNSQIIISTIDNNINGIDDIDFGQVNSDTLPDLVAISPNLGQVLKYENVGNGQFGSSQVINNSVASSSYESDIILIDIDNDGDNDIIGTSTYSPFQIINTGNGNFSGATPALNYGIREMEVIDWNNDGLDDILTVQSSQIGPSNWSIRIYTNLGTYFDHLLFQQAEIQRYVLACDINNDNYTDILSGGISWYNNQSANSYSSEISLQNESSTIEHFADFNQDGFLDALTGNKFLNNNTEFGIYWNNGDGTFDSLDVMLSNSTVTNSAISDYDLDGDIDIIISTSSEILFFENNSGTFLNPIQLFSYQSSFSMTTFDMDNDGDEDLVSMHNLNFTGPGEIVFFENNNGIFGLPSTIQSVNFATSYQELQGKDIDNDGLIDITNWKNGSVITWKNNGSGFDNETTLIDYGNIILNVNFDDFNSDGYLDIIHTSVNTNEVAVALNDSTGHFNNTITISGNLLSPNGIILYDFNNNGLKDIIVSAESSPGLKGLYFIENENNFNFSSPVIFFETYFGTKKMHLEDLNNDTKPELIHISQESFYLDNFFSHQFILSGNTFLDENINGVRDSLEIGLSSSSVELSPIENSSITTYTGDYYFAVLPGTYTVENNLSSIFWTLTSDSITYTCQLDSSISVIDSLDFGFIPDSIMADASCDITGGFPRCNSIVNYWLNVSNTGSSLLNGVIHLSLDDSLTFISSNFTPDSVVNNNIYWSFDTLQYFSSQSINVKTLMPDWQSINDSITSYLNIDYSDIQNSNINTISDTLHQTIVCAYDPNDKTVSPKGLGEPGYIIGDETLEYLIRFQNTGNDTALNVKIIDQLNSNIDFNSFHFISSSHLVQFWIDSSGVIEFNFNNINLPDSSVDFLGSQGFVKFQVNLKQNLPIGTEIKNKAGIFFDFNPIINTNYVLNTIYECTQLEFSNPTIPSAICLNETIELSPILQPFEECNWLLNQIFYSDSNNLSYTPINTTPFQITAIKHTPICSTDTTFNISILDIDSVFISEFLCNGEFYDLNGSITTHDTTIMITETNQHGCDSLVYIGILYPDTPIIQNNNGLLFANVNANSYQWIDCSTMTPISGANNQTYSPMWNGEYTVVTELNNCYDTSACITINDLGIFQNGHEKGKIIIYPNPTLNDQINIQTGLKIDKVEIYNMLGSAINYTFDSNHKSISLKGHPKGTYIIKIITESETTIKKITLK